ncbi:hypothetical protein I7I48_11015 [Histoplasma ohiense]|nr:hypothetical protein I7I48_11015 [Histoplasma ohiense (nom. inval.)]
MKGFTHPQQMQKRRRRTLLLQVANHIQSQPKSTRRVKTPKRPREDDEAPSSHASPHRPRTSATPISEARVEHWTKNGAWPTEEEEEQTMDRFRDIVNDALARKRSSSLNRKRSNASLNTETAQAQTSSQQLRDQKSAPYKHPLFGDQLKECDSFIDDCDEGISAQSKKLCQTRHRSHHLSILSSLTITCSRRRAKGSGARTRPR